MIQSQCPKQYGQHRWKPGMTALQDVASIWEREHPNLAAPSDLGCRNYRPRHALVAPARKRVYL